MAHIGKASGTTVSSRVATGLAPRRFASSLVFLFVFAIAIAIVLPFLVKGFVVFQLTQVMIYAVAILGLNLLTGISGQFSLGHGAFFAIGAYSTAIAIDSFGLSVFWTLPIAAIVCFAAGFLFGLPALRLEGVYLALATFSLAVATPQLLKLSVLSPWTGGVQGVFLARPGVGPLAPFGLPLTDDQWLYFVALAVGLALYWLARNLVASRTGRALLAIRDNPVAASAMGVNVPLYKAVAFAISALYAGIAGAMSAIVIQFVAPDSFGLSLSIALLVGLVIGGVGWLPGALVGGLFLVFVPNIAEDVSKGLSGAVYGVLLLLLIYVMPSGAGGLVRTAADVLARRRGKP